MPQSMPGGLLALALALLAAAQAPPPSGSAAATLHAGALKVRVSADPFVISFRDRASGEVLRTLGGGAPAPEDLSARSGRSAPSTCGCRCSTTHWWRG